MFQFLLWTVVVFMGVCIVCMHACVYVGVGELSVLLQEGSRTTPLWWRSEDQGDAWRRGEVLVGRTPHVFTLFFQATRTFSQLGDIAIDDILFLNCSLPGEQQTRKVTVDMVLVL